MKKILFLFLITVFAISCGTGGSPESVAKNFTENLAKGNYTEAKKYATESSGQMIDLLATLGGEIKNSDSNFKFKATSEEIDGNEATVYYINEDGEEDTVELVKVDGKWKVSISK